MNDIRAVLQIHKDYKANYVFLCCEWSTLRAVLLIAVLVEAS